VSRVVIGLDPHKRSATIEVLDSNEQQLTAGRFGTDSESYQRLLAAGRQFPRRIWAVGVARSARTDHPQPSRHQSVSPRLPLIWRAPRRQRDEEWLQRV
jgi:hypothetical protein